MCNLIMRNITGIKMVSIASFGSALEGWKGQCLAGMGICVHTSQQRVELWFTPGRGRMLSACPDTVVQTLYMPNGMSHMYDLHMSAKFSA